ncbi:unnamed protein product [Cylindrotheca closterium]|uniref:Uncharacterized protein n=1 Tax=Cylindrotheca closterium TaxID=2856 RepID=A0AAD2FG23_9STRA|nr:unnamed protein product [Cylindrotheca closterium]
MGKTIKKFVFHSFGFKGFVRVAESDSLKDVRKQILEKVDDHLIPKGDWIFSVDDIQVGAKQEEEEMAWEDIIDQNKKVVLVQTTFPLKRKSPPPALLSCKTEIITRPDNGAKPSRKRNRSENPRQQTSASNFIDLTGDDDDEVEDMVSTEGGSASNTVVISPDDEPSDRPIVPRVKARAGRRKSTRPIAVVSKDEFSGRIAPSESEIDRRNTARRAVTSTPVTPERELSNPGGRRRTVQDQ